jgi:RNA polymerase sigma-70 factor (ECF subfamily)
VSNNAGVVEEPKSISPLGSLSLVAEESRARTMTSDEDFVSFARETTPGLLRAVRKLAPRGSDVEGIASEALARAYLHWERIGPVGYRVAWVNRVAMNLAYDAGRREARSLKVVPEPQSTGTFDDWSDLRVDLVLALKGLSAKQREALVLHHIADLPVDEVAQVMKISPGTVRKHLERALASLRKSLGARAEEVAK